MAIIKLNGSLKLILFVVTIVGIVYGFGAKSKELEKDDEANALAIKRVDERHVEDMLLFRGDLKTIMADIKTLLGKP